MSGDKVQKRIKESADQSSMAINSRFENEKENFEDLSSGMLENET